MSLKRNMMLLMWPAVLMLLASCSPGQKTELTGEGNFASSSSCLGAPQKLSLGELQIQGKGQAQTSELVMTSLSQDLNCANGSHVDWKASSAEVISSDSSRLVAQFRQPGSYLIQAKVGDSTESKTLAVETTVVDNMPVLRGPQVGMIGMNLAFTLVIPEGLPVVAARWSFGDGQAVSITENFATPQSHVYSLPGDMNLQVSVQLDNGSAYELNQKLRILDYYDNFECLADVQIFAPQIADVNTPVDLHARIPSCLLSSVSAVRWNYGDATTLGAGLSVQHTYEKVGVYTVSADIYSPLSGNSILFSLTHQIRIQEKSVEEPPPKCQILGEVKNEYINEVESQEACGTEGKRQVTRHTRVTFECRVQDLIQDWVETGREEQVKQMGECQGQSCVLPGGGLLSDGASQILYSSSRPEGRCENSKQERLCRNGDLSGSQEFQYAQCQNACEGFGPSGTLKTGIVVGEEQVALQCAFGETGFFDVYLQTVDRSCHDGQIQSTLPRRGELKSKGSCPTYQWKALDEWTLCDADCGGKQSQVYRCVDQNGETALAERCSGSAPVVQRLCDANPEAVRREESTTLHEEANSSNQCPKNQIGIVLKSRDVTTKKIFACLDHQVKVESETLTATPWETETYCRDYVAHRCSHDSLSNSEAQKRYQWMVKCQDQVPVIKEFLESFQDVKDSQKNAVSGGARVLYPTFMNAGVKPEKPWIAPKDPKASCAVPTKVYVSAVCVSSCATPEQMILTEIKGERHLKAQSFIDALAAKTAQVVTLSARSTLRHQSLQTTAVSTWVTELLDGEHEILVFKMHSGGELRLTPNHPLLSSEGVMREAADFRTGEALVRLGGVRDEIVSIHSTTHFGKVYNLFTASSEIHRNIVVTNGYLNGTAFFQNEGSQNLNRQLLRGRLVKGALK